MKGANFKEYADKGYSGKNTDRPNFKRLINDIEARLISKVVVYKLDRISRSIIDFANRLEQCQLDGINTKRFAADPETAEHIKLMFEIYAQPNTSFGDILRHFNDKGITTEGIELTRSQISSMLKNPSYVQADLAVYEFFKSQGAAIVNDPKDFEGTNGCYFFKGRDSTENKRASIKGHILVIAPHKGLVSSDIWLACRKKLMNNTTFSSNNHKANVTWLAGSIKCGRCGAALTGRLNPRGYAYFRCRRRTDTKSSCDGCGTLHINKVENSIYCEMVKKLDEFKKLTHGSFVKANPKMTALNVELAQIDKDIESLLNTLTGANPILLVYANSRIEELDEKRQSLLKEIAEVQMMSVSPDNVRSISDYLDNWDSLEFDDRRLVVSGLISRIQATSESMKIEWKI